MMLKVGNATEVRFRLLNEHSVCVRDCSSFGLPEYIRIGIRNMDDNRRFAKALKQVLDIQSTDQHETRNEKTRRWA